MTPWRSHFASTQPLFWPLAPLALRIEQWSQWPTVEECDALARSLTTPGVRFVPSAPPPRRKPATRPPSYDAHIVERGEVPTRRNNWHDLFNWLVWCAFPKSKRAVHARQLRTQAERNHDRSTRTREQDALALLDEGSALLLYRADDPGALDGLDREESEPLASRVRTERVVPVVFGHAVYEHLATREGAIRAMAVPLACDTIPAHAADRVARADALLAQLIDDTAQFLDPRNTWRVPVSALAG